MSQNVSNLNAMFWFNLHCYFLVILHCGLNSLNSEQWMYSAWFLVLLRGSDTSRSQVSSSESSRSLGSSSFSSHLKNSFINSSTGLIWTENNFVKYADEENISSFNLLKVSNHRIIKITERTLDVIFSRIRGFAFTKTLKQKPMRSYAQSA